MSITRLQQLLTRKLKLKAPRYVLTRDGHYINGSVISESFRGKGDLQRQLAIWGALEAELGEEAIDTVGMIIAYTPKEWELDPIRQ
jgi:acid stress-induced BolA-like protein IbaG/YrbA